MNAQTDPAVKPAGFRWKLRYTILALIWIGWMMSFLDRMVMSLSLPFIGRDMHLAATSQGAIISAFFFGYALCQIPGGLLADRFGARKVMSIGIAWWSVFTTCTGLVGNYSIMLVLRCLFGVGEGCFPGASWKMIATYFPPRERATATAVQSTVNTLGPALASLVAAGIIAAFGWRTMFIFLGIPGLVIAAAMYFYCWDAPKDHPRITAEELREIEGGEVDSAAGSSGADTTFKQFLKSPLIWQMVLIWFLFDITFWGFTSWLPSYLMKVRGFTIMQTGVAGSLPFLVGAVGTLIGGYISDRIELHYNKWVFVPNALIAAVFLYLTYTVASANMAVVYQTISAFFMFLAMAAFWGLVMHSIPPHIMGACSGTVNFGGQVAGFVSPFIMGYLIDRSGGNFDTAFVFLICALVAAALVTVTLSGKKSEARVVLAP